jgi:hypothetical protein
MGAITMSINDEHPAIIPSSLSTGEIGDYKSESGTDYYAYHETRFMDSMFAKLLKRSDTDGPGAFAGFKQYLELVVTGGRVWDKQVLVARVQGHAATLLYRIRELEKAAGKGGK